MTDDMKRLRDELDDIDDLNDKKRIEINEMKKELKKKNLFSGTDFHHKTDDSEFKTWRSYDKKPE